MQKCVSSLFYAFCQVLVLLPARSFCSLVVDAHCRLLPARYFCLLTADAHRRLLLLLACRRCPSPAAAAVHQPAEVARPPMAPPLRARPGEVAPPTMLRLLVRSSREAQEVCSHPGLGKLRREAMASLSDAQMQMLHIIGVHYCSTGYAYIVDTRHITFCRSKMAS
jgi:hypothetical protein